jgi:RNA polymerase sigma-70 factor, ECF subfamily
MASGPEALTSLLVRWRAGDEQARDRIVEATYEELRRMAGRHMRQERQDHTLDPGALVNELYLRLCASEPVNWQNRAHFFAVAAQQLRRILINHARDRRAQKRGGSCIRLSLGHANGLAAERQEDLLEVDEALQRLEALDARAGRVVELRFFGGLSERETADVLGISVATLKRDWNFARVWLLRELRSSSRDPG